MKRSIWLGPWDLEDRDPDIVLDELVGLGLNACSLALSYHGGRMVLPRHPKRFVYELHPSAVYVPVELSEFGRLKPEVSPLSAIVPAFLDAAQRRGFPVWAWTVLCHNDHLGTLAPDCCVENAFGDRYTYALCPSHPDVQKYVVALCAALSAIPGITGLDVEALSFLGHEHASLHDKCGVDWSTQKSSLLSLCFCEYCHPPDELRRAVRHAIRTDGEVDWSELLAIRQSTLQALLSKLRTAVGHTPINLRISLDPRFHGGKTALPLHLIAGLVNTATITFFGANLESIRQQLAELSATKLPIEAGFVFHGPDCTSLEDLLAA